MKLSFKLPGLRLVNQLGFWLCVGAMAFALYLQYYNALSPCPLCIAQRLLICLLGLGFLFGWLHLFRGTQRVVHGLCVLLLAAIGAGFAGRQVWLEQLPPDQVPPCGPGLMYMLEHLPFSDMFKLLFQGTAECAEVSWKMFGLSIPSWTLMLFVLFIFLGIWEIFREDEN